MKNHSSRGCMYAANIIATIILAWALYVGFTGYAEHYKLEQERAQHPAVDVQLP